MTANVVKAAVIELPMGGHNARDLSAKVEVRTSDDPRIRPGAFCAPKVSMPVIDAFSVMTHVLGYRWVRKGQERA